jgi:hypothetical protein
MQEKENCHGRRWFLLVVIGRGIVSGVALMASREDLLDARLRILNAKAGEVEGSLVDKETIAREHHTFWRRVRDVILTVPIRDSHKIVGLSAEDAYPVLDRIIRDLLVELTSEEFFSNAGGDEQISRIDDSPAAGEISVPARDVAGSTDKRKRLGGRAPNADKRRQRGTWSVEDI